MTLKLICLRKNIYSAAASFSSFFGGGVYLFFSSLLDALVSFWTPFFVFL